MAASIDLGRAEIHHCFRVLQMADDCSESTLRPVSADSLKSSDPLGQSAWNGNPRSDSKSSRRPFCTGRMVVRAAQEAEPGTNLHSTHFQEPVQSPLQL